MKTFLFLGTFAVLKYVPHGTEPFPQLLLLREKFKQTRFVSVPLSSTNALACRNSSLPPSHRQQHKSVVLSAVIAFVVESCHLDPSLPRKKLIIQGAFVVQRQKPVIPSNVTIHFSRFIRAGTSLPRIAVATQGPQNPISNRPQPKDRKRETGRNVCTHSPISLEK